MSSLQEYVVQFDFEDNKLRLWSAKCVPSQQWGTLHPLRLGTGGCPRIAATPGALLAIDFVIDTGATGAGHLDAYHFAACQRSGNLTRSRSVVFVSSVGGREKASQGQLDRFSVDALVDHDLEFTESDQNRIGMQYLRKFVVTLDFPRGNLHLRRRDSWQMPPEPMGVQALWLDDLLTVTQVDPGSPAARAAVQAGDIIVTLDGHDASCLDLGALTRLLRVRQGMPITMRVRRGIECLEITVPPSANVPCVEGGISTSSATR